MSSEFLRKYGVWIAAGLVVFYLLLRGRGSTVTTRSGVDPELAREELRQRGAAAERSSRSALEEARLRAQLDAERIRQQTELARIALSQQGLEAQRAAARAAQQAGLLNAVIGAIGKLLGGASSGGRSMPSGGNVPSTPPTFPRQTASTAPGSTIPAPAGIGPLIFEPSFQPEFPTPNLSATFETPDLTFDSGYSFAYQSSYEIPEPDIGPILFDPFYQPDYPTFGEGEVNLPEQTFEEITPSTDYSSFDYGSLYDFGGGGEGGSGTDYGFSDEAYYIE